MSVNSGHDNAVENKTLVSFSPTIEVKTLPSKWLPYPNGVKISYRPYVFGEIKKYNQSNMSLRDKYTFMLSGVIADGMDVWDLTVPDFLFIQLLRKISTFGDTECSISYKCPGCNRLSEHQFKSSDIIFDDLFDGVDINGVPKCPVTVKVSHGDMQFSPLNCRGYLDAQDFLQSNPDYDDGIYMLATMCTSHSVGEAYKKIYDGTYEDSFKFEYLDELLYHGMAQKSFTCRNKINSIGTDGAEVVCNTTTPVEVDSGEAFIAPFHGDAESIKNGIRFGD
jgi:hypothetical protein